MVNKASKVGQFEETIGWKSRLVEKQDIIHIAILAVVVFVIGAYLIATRVLIAKDGVFYIELAKRIAANPVEAVNMPSRPGYPFLIYLMHKAAALFSDAEAMRGWLISAQIVSLLSKVIASVALYFVGSYFVGPRMSFLGVLILSILPDSAEYGSDALTEWPHLMFLTTGFLLLLLGLRFCKSWIFGLAGIVAALGYLIRSEGCQLILYGSAWLVFNLIRPRKEMRGTKAAAALILFLGGFVIIAVPYMWFKGYVFPGQHIWELPGFLNINSDNFGCISNINICFAGLSINRIIGSETLITGMCETLVYYFIPPLLIGCYYYFRGQSKTLEQRFFAAAFIAVNVVILLWQSSYRHALSRRYMLALVAFTVFYIPLGFHIIACWISKHSKRCPAAEENIRRWFFILMMVGFGICAAKFVRITPLRWERQGYRDAAEWLNKNTAPAAIIAVPDNRIAFYAERQGLEYSKRIPERVDYIVRIVKSGDEKLRFGKDTNEKYVTWADKRKKDEKLVIYKVIR